MSLWNQPPLKMMIDNKTQLNNSTEYDTLNAWILKLVFHRPISLAYQINKITGKKMDWKIVTAWQLKVLFIFILEHCSCNLKHKSMINYFYSFKGYMWHCHGYVQGTSKIKSS